MSIEAGMERWRNRVALVTGSSGGIGAAVAETLVKNGMIVIGCARNKEKIDNLAKDFEGKGYLGKMVGFKCDVANDKEIDEMFDWIEKGFGGVDVCVCNAGFSTKENLLEITAQQMRDMLNVNVVGLAVCSRNAANSMIKRGVDDGHIFHLNSMSGHRLTGILSFYGATKYAVTALTEGFRRELVEKSHIRVTQLSPGLVRTEFLSRAFEDEAVADSVFSRVDRVMLPQDIANILLFALSTPANVQPHMAGINRYYSRHGAGDRESQRLECPVEYRPRVKSNEDCSATKKATVEVIVKVKKRRSSGHTGKGTGQDDLEIGHGGYKKGSWGDLLTQHTTKANEAKKKIEADKEVMMTTSVPRYPKSEAPIEPVKSICRQIPITSDLYIETIMNVRESNKNEKVGNQNQRSNGKSGGNRLELDEFEQKLKQKLEQKQLNYEAQNDYLRYEIDRLRTDLDVIKQEAKERKFTPPGDFSTGIIKRVPQPIKSDRADKDAKVLKASKSIPTFTRTVRVENKGVMTSVSDLEANDRAKPTRDVLDKKRSSRLTPVKEVATSTENSKSEERTRELQLRRENESLKREAAELLAQKEKTRKEQQESIMTIKELYQLAEMLKRENQQLVVAQEEQQLLHQKLLRAVSENQELKQYLDSLMNQQKESPDIDRLQQIRNVLQEVKSTIQEEIKGISEGSSGALPSHESIRGLSFNITGENSALLNDTNASEIQQIFESYGQPENHGTSGVFRDYQSPMCSPSQLQFQTEVGRSKFPSADKFVGSADFNDILASFVEDVSRSFRPIQTELMNASSSSEFGPSSSTPTPPTSRSKFS